jgi:hypothetical protein
MLYTLVLFIAFLLALRYIKGFHTPYLSHWNSLAAFSIKFGVGLYFLYIYTAVYGNGSLSADAGAFMNESAILHKVFYTSPLDYFKLLFGFGDQEALVKLYLQDTSHWDSGAQAIVSDNRNILRVHSVLHFISFGDAARHVLVMCFISLMGIQQLFMGIRRHTDLRDSYVFWILTLFPSLLFWTSGLLKEPLLFLGIGLLVRAMLDALSLKKRLWLGTLGVLLILGFKPYVLICALPALLFYLGYRYVPRFKLLAAILLLLLPVALLFSFSSVRQKTAHVFSQKQYDFQNVGRGGLHAEGDSCFYFFEAWQIPELNIEGDSVEIVHPMQIKTLQYGAMNDPVPATLEPEGEKWHIYFRNDRSDGFIRLEPIHDSFAQLLLNAPEALLNSLFRPYVMDPGSWLKYPATLEVIGLYAFLLFAVFRRRAQSVRNQALIGALLVFALCLSLTIGWVTPVIGAIVRYRIPVFAALLLIALLLIRSKKHTQ